MAKAERPACVSLLPGAAAAGRSWQRPALLGVLLLSVVMHFLRLEEEGFGNLYYAATVKSMLTGWSNFFFASFDPGGFVAVDKPPLGLWIQTASATMFGFNGLSLHLPQAMAGVLSVALLFSLVRRVFGPTAGLIAALVLTVTPISVVADRNNTMDGQLVFTSLLAAWAIGRAAALGSLRWLLLSAALVGLGFNIKMLQAFLVLPAIYALYLVAPSLSLWKRLAHLMLATLVLATVSLAWPLAVDLTPPDRRPYVGSSRDNTVMELIVGHNGLTRLLPRGFRGPVSPPPGGYPVSPPPNQNRQPLQPEGGLPSGLPAQPGIGPTTGTPIQPGPRPPTGPPLQSYPAPGQPGPSSTGGPAPPAPGNGPPMAGEIGEPGPLRLFNSQLGGQASWLLPLAGLGALVAAWQTRPCLPLRPLHQALLFWVAWLLPQLVFFSVANLFHRYYLEMLSPAIAALAGAGVVAMWSDYRLAGDGSHQGSKARRGARSEAGLSDYDGLPGTSAKPRRWRGWLLPVVLMGTAGVEVYILVAGGFGDHWLVWLILGLTFVAGGGLGGLLVGKARVGRRDLPSKALVAAGLSALLIAPTIWAAMPVLARGNRGLPAAGPQTPPGSAVSVPSAASQRPQVRVSGLPDVKKLVDYVLAARRGERFLLATLDANTAAPIILTTGEPVMALGGFSGGDRILSADGLAHLVAGGSVRFFLLPRGVGQQIELTQWVSRQCETVSPALWQARPPGPAGPASPGGSQDLFDCGRFATRRG